MNNRKRSNALQARAQELIELAPTGEMTNQQAAMVALMAEFGCTKKTAVKHTARAARRKCHPDWTPPQWGGKRPGAGRKPEYAIDVADGRCIVSEKVAGQFGLLQYSAAVNWEELEAEAATAVQAQGGAINISGIYLCPPELVERAVWD